MEQLDQVDPDPGQEVLTSPELLAEIFSHFSQLQQVLAANGVCRQWRQVLKEVYLERHLTVVVVGTVPENPATAPPRLQQVMVKFNPNVDAERNFLFNRNYATKNERLCLTLRDRQPAFYISKLAISGWAAKSNVVRLELIDCLTRDEWGEIGLIILKALRRCLETVRVELIPNAAQPNRLQQHIPVCFRKLGDEWQQVEQRELAEAKDENQPPPTFDCPKLREFVIRYWIETLGAENLEQPELQVELAELERFVRGGPREIFALCPNLQKFHLIGEYVDGRGQRVQIANGIFDIPNVGPDNHWRAFFPICFLDHPDKPAPPHRPVQLLNHCVRDLFTAELRHPLRQLTSLRIPDVLSVLKDNPALCENLEAVKFYRLYNQPREHIEYLTSTKDLQNMRSLFWSLDLRAQVDLKNEGFQLPPLDADQQPLFPKLQVLYLHRERKPDPTATEAPIEGFMVENWLCENYLRLAPNIHRLLINVYSWEYNWSGWRGYDRDIQNGLKLASSLQVKELVLIVRHATVPGQPSHTLVAEEAIPCLKGIESLTVAAVTSTLLTSLGEFFIRACQPGRPSEDPAVNSTIRRIGLYQYPDIEDVQPGYIPFRIDYNLRVTFPEGLEVVGGRWGRVHAQLLEVPPPPPPPAPAHGN